MELIVFDRDSGFWSERLHEFSLNQKKISGSIFIREIQFLIDYLRTFARTPRLVVVVGADSRLFAEPEWAGDLAGLLQDVHLVLVLADDSPETAAECHRLRPRYMTSMEDVEGNLLKVLDRIVERYAHQAD